MKLEGARMLKSTGYRAIEPETDLNKDQNTAEDTRSKYKLSRSLYEKQYDLTWKGALHVNLATARISARKRRSTGREGAGDCNIMIKDLETLWKKQNGLCYYTGMPMRYDSYDWRVSLERIDVNKGYINENIVLCVREMNASVQWNHEKIKTMFQIIEGNGEDGTTIKETVDENDHMYCHLKRLLACSKGRDGKFGKSLKKKEGVYDLDIEFMKKLYADQKGRCAISGMPLKFGTNLCQKFIASIDRKNSHITYQKDNVRLVCYEFNTGDSSYNRVQTAAENEFSAWTPEKFAMFRHSYINNKPWIKAAEIDAYRKTFVSEASTSSAAPLARPSYLINENVNIPIVDLPSAVCVKCNKSFSYRKTTKYLNVCGECMEKRKEERKDFYEENKDAISHKCVSCEKMKLLKHFHFTYEKQNCCDGICKQCKLDQDNARFQTNFDSYLKLMLNQTRKIARRSPHIPDDVINLQQLKEIWNNQGGKCYYSGETLTQDGPNKAAICRDSMKVGFTIENTHLCTSAEKKKHK